MWASAAQWGEFGDSPCFEAGEATRKVQGRNMADTVSWWAFREGVYQRLVKFKFKKTNATLAHYTIQAGSCLPARTEGSRSQ